MLRRISLIALLIAIAMPSYAQIDTGEEWRKQIVIRLSASKRFPLEARGQTGTAQVGFVLDRQGRLVSHWLEQSTGNHTLDVESLAIVERAQPFPIPPPELDETHLRMSAPFVFAARPAHYLRESPDSWEQEQARLRAKVGGICRGC